MPNEAAATAGPERPIRPSHLAAGITQNEHVFAWKDAVGELKNASRLQFVRQQRLESLWHIEAYWIGRSGGKKKERPLRSGRSCRTKRRDKFADSQGVTAGVNEIVHVNLVMRN